MAKHDPYATGLSIGQMLAHAKGREDKHSVGFARTGQPAPSPEQELMAAIEAKIFGSPFNNVGPPQRDPNVGRPMRMPTRSDTDYADNVRARRQWLKSENAPDSDTMSAAYDEARRLEDLIPKSDDPALGGAPLGEREAYAYFDRRDAAAPTINSTAAMPLIAAQLLAAKQAQKPQSSSPSRSFISAPRSSGRGGSPYFMAGPSSQEGMDAASAMLQQRLAALQQGPQMDILFRRDPRAATALIQSQMASRDAEADRMQRGDLAGQEMDYRNRSLDMQTRESGLDRESLTNRLLMQLAGQRQISGDRMDFESRLSQQNQAAAALEAERNRTLQSQLAQSQQQFQGNLADKQMQHSGGLAKDQAALAREQMLNDLTMKRAELLGLDKRAQDDLRGRMMAEFAGAAASRNAEDFPIIQKRFMDMLAQGTPGAAPAAAPPRLAIDTVDPTLRGAWDKLSTGKDGATKKSVAEFIKSIPEVDRKTHRDALRTYIQTRYPDAMQNQSYGSPFSSRAAVNDELRAELGESPQGNLWSDLRAANPLGLMLDPLAATPQGRVEAGQRLLSKFNPF